MIAAFVFSLVLSGLSFIDVIPVFLHLKSTVYGAPQGSQKEPHEEVKEDQKSSEDDGEQ